MKSSTQIQLALACLAGLAVVSGTVLSVFGVDATPAWGALTFIIGALGGQQLPSGQTSAPVP